MEGRADLGAASDDVGISVSASVSLTVLASEGLRLLDFARQDPGRIVPHYPSWTLRDLVTHVASIHSRTVLVCTTLPQESIPAARLPHGRDAFDWYEETLSTMVTALRETDPDSEVWAFASERKVSAWERRMVIETGVHRWDAQQAIEEPDPLLPVVAESGLEEFADLWLPLLGKVPDLCLVASDLGRAWRFGGAESSAAVTVTGSASDLYLRLMARAGTPLPAEWERAVDGLDGPAS